MRLVVCLLVFLVLAAEAPDHFAGRWHTPMAYLYPLVERLRHLPFSVWDLSMVAVGLAASLRRSAWRGRVRALDLSLLAALAGLGAATAWGWLRGGDIRQVYFQVAGLLVLMITTHVLIAVLRTPRDFEWLGRAVLAAALYRAVTCLVFFFLFLRDGSFKPYPQNIVGHDVSVLWVTALLGLGSWALVRFRTTTLLVVVPLSLMLLAAVHYNNRRVAWVELAGGAAMLVLAMPLRRISARTWLAWLLVACLALVYVGVGWGRSERVFRPLERLQSAISGEDDSSLSRDIENTGLVVTLRTNLLGTGLGHEYHEVSTVYSEGMRSFFEQYRYMPHNSVLGMAAFTGVLVFPAIWTVLPVGAYLAARTSLLSPAPRQRLLAMVAFATPLVYGIQAHGDMGLQSATANVVLGVALAVSSRLAVYTGAWPGRGRRAAYGVESESGEPLRRAR